MSNFEYLIIAGTVIGLLLLAKIADKLGLILYRIEQHFDQINSQ